MSQNNYNVGVIGKKIKSSINVNVLKNLIKKITKYYSIINGTQKLLIGSASSIYLTGTLEKLFKLIFNTSNNQIETINDLIISLSSNKKLLKLFLPFLLHHVVKTEYIQTNFIKNHKTSKYIKTSMFQNILDTYKITNIKLTNELGDFLCKMFYYISRKIILTSIRLTYNTFRKTLYTCDIEIAIMSIIPQSIATTMIRKGTTYVINYSS